jgi:hypothetical protein
MATDPPRSDGSALSYPTRAPINREFSYLRMFDQQQGTGLGATFCVRGASGAAPIGCAVESHKALVDRNITPHVGTSRRATMTLSAELTSSLAAHHLSRQSPDLVDRGFAPRGAWHRGFLRNELAGNSFL